MIGKKIALVSAVAAAILCSAAHAAPVAGGIVTFNGEVTEGACAVAGTDANKVVALDTIRSNIFSAADQPANAKKAFNLSLVDCDTEKLKEVQVTFGGQTVQGKPNLLANTASAGSAQGVALQLFGPDGAPLAVGGDSSAVKLNASTTIPLSVDYVSTAAAVKAGKVQSVATFTLAYN